jgi:hypothetical protein
MKKTILLLLWVLTGLSVATAQAPKYVLLEHFTNTRCSVCGGANPSFYQNIGINSNTKLHHISIHSSIPYSACVFYQANTTPQDARAGFYNVPGTPRVASCSPIQVKVTETNNGGSSRSASIQVKSLGAPPSGNYRLLVAVVEKDVYYNAPNGESVHHNVFRQFLTETAGNPLNLAVQGSETAVNFNYSINANWVANEVYVLAWLFDEATKAVLNSGTKFDAQIIPIELGTWKGSVLGNKTRLEWTTLTEQNTDFFEIEHAIDGQTFASIGRVKAAGNASTLLKYAFDDEKTAANLNYYRLKTVDLDGSSTLSNIISVVKKLEKTNDLVVFPSATTGKIQVSYTSDENTADNQWRILDGFGRVVQSFSRPSKAVYTDGTSRDNREGTQLETFDVSSLPSGLYFVQLIQDKTLSTKRFVKTQ